MANTQNTITVEKARDYAYWTGEAQRILIRFSQTEEAEKGERPDLILCALDMLENIKEYFRDLGSVPDGEEL